MSFLHLVRIGLINVTKKHITPGFAMLHDSVRLNYRILSYVEARRGNMTKSDAIRPAKYCTLCKDPGNFFAAPF